jgi:subtilisin family serine protease
VLLQTPSKSGIVVVVADNNNEDARYTAASEPSVLTVGASTDADALRSPTTVPAPVDVMAPGVAF